ncbi:MAG: hypothetical protein ABJN14_22085 [Paracoccaceae bacterium]
MTEADTNSGIIHLPIFQDDRGFLFWPDAWETPSIGLQTERLRQCVDEVRARSLFGVFGRHPEFRETNISCLLELPDLTAVQLWDVTLNDISALYGLPRLSHFRISGKRPPIDFKKMTSVQHLVLEHHKNDTGISTLMNLKMMNLWQFKAKVKETFEFGLPKGIEELGIFWSNVEGLEGFGICPNVKSLRVARCRNLQSLGDLRTTFPKLEHLVVEACGRLTADEAKRALIGQTNIKHAFAGKQLIVSEKS